ncbi:guanylate kinase [Rubritalea profundi]|uniref:Guanylate kinase n=1 Tax=Rubritalea profundi TaxID=1658618 RepID=A0A2S7U3L5_9BACT|nr:guanylate kinase [Rubritalea profundi]PQJ29615.1 guanylate kinase [Rubritalea profundi]
MSARTGILYLVSGPSGSGKTTLCRRLSNEDEASYAISCTTRKPRPGEENGKDYFFLSIPEFQNKIATGELLEHAEVHGNFYGTLLSEVLNKLEAGVDVVMDIDVQGAALVRESKHPIIQHSLVDIFIMPPNAEELRKRLTGRGTDSQEIIETRMRNSLDEMEHWPKYSFRIVSGSHEEDYIFFKALLHGERLRISRHI